MIRRGTTPPADAQASVGSPAKVLNVCRWFRVYVGFCKFSALRFRVFKIAAVVLNQSAFMKGLRAVPTL